MRRAGNPFQCGSGLPFISKATIVLSSSARCTGRLFTKSGVAGRAGPSAPLKKISTALSEMPAFSSRSLSLTPVQRALPMAPIPHSTPCTCGWNSPRRLPEHWHTAVISTGLEVLPKLLEGEFHRLLRRVAADLQPPRLGIDLLRNAREVIAHEERVVARDGIAEVIDRCFEIGRPVAALDVTQSAGRGNGDSDSTDRSLSVPRSRRQSAESGTASR